MNDPLKNPAFNPPGLVEKLMQAFLGAERPIECAQIEVTSHCFGACVYCPHTTQKAAWKSRHMSDNVFAALWPLLRRARRAHLQGWGEPLLHPRFFDYADLALRAGCNVSTTSSGLKLAPEIASRLAASGMDLIAFSLVGTDAESNSPRVNVDFDAVAQSIKTLRQAIRETETAQPLEIHIAYLMLADRMEAVKKLPALMDELDVDMAIVSTLDYLALPEQRELAFNPQDEAKIARAREILEPAAEQAASSGRVLHFSLPGKETAPSRGGCRENIGSSLFIDADGNISPCVYLNVPGDDPDEKRRVYGNCAQANPLDIWRCEEYRQFRSRLKNNEPDTACLNCPKRFEK